MGASLHVIGSQMKRLLQINPVLRVSTSTGRIMQEIGELALNNGWESYVAYAKGRDGVKPCASQIVPVGNVWSTAWHGLQTRLFDRHGLASTQATHAFVRRIEEIAPDIIHIHNLHGYFLDYRVLFRYLSRCGIPVVWTVHDCWLYTGHCYYYSYVGCDKWQRGCNHCPQKKEFPASWLFDRSARNYVDKRAAFASMPHEGLVFVPVSHWLEGEMRQSFLRDYDFQVIHNGINLDVFRVCDSRGVVAKYGLEGKHVILGVASIWSKEKGLDDFVAMAAMLRRDEVIVLVGVKEEQKSRLPRNIVAIGRTENVRQLAELYACADAFVNPTWQDNYPTVNLEAIACGTPVVTYRTGGSVEAITPDTGRIVEQGDVAGLLGAVRDIARRRKADWQSLCRAHALAHFDKNECYADYFRLYDALMGRRSNK